MKKIIIVAIAIFSFGIAKAQTSGTNWLKFGLHAGIPVGDESDVSSFMIGLDAKYQFLGIDSFAMGISTGYSHYFGKETDSGYKFEDKGLIPLAALFRFYVTRSFFIGTDLGYGFFTKEGSEGGFYYRPEFGYHDNFWNIYGFYQGVSVDGISPTAVGIGLNYNIVRGK